MGSGEGLFLRWEMMSECRWKGDQRKGDDEINENHHHHYHHHRHLSPTSNHKESLFFSGTNH